MTDGAPKRFRVKQSPASLKGKRKMMHWGGMFVCMLVQRQMSSVKWSSHSTFGAFVRRPGVLS